jgi:predicted acetyltransferase
VGYHEELDGNLVLRSLDDERDIDRFAEFNGEFNNEHEGRTCACFLRYQPGRTLDDTWIVEDTASGEVVATVCLIPWRIRYGNVELRAAMLEMVLTHHDYRGRGLVRKLIGRFHARVQEQQYDLCFIWGIPYFYRQFGYSYAVDGDVREVLPAWRIPHGSVGHRLRAADTADIPALMAMHEHATAGLDICVKRDAAHWEYLLRYAEHPVKILAKDAHEVTCGYAVILPSAAHLDVVECSLPTMADGMALLQLLRQTALPEVRIAWPQHGTLAKLVHAIGSQVVCGSQWLWRIPDVPQLLLRIAPVLGERLAASPWHAFTNDVVVNTYRTAYRLSFIRGELARAEATGFVDSSMGTDGGDLCIPPEALVRLLLGYRTLDELFDAWPDIIVKPERRNLFETLFPRLSAYLYTPYHYLGQR